MSLSVSQGPVENMLVVTAPDDEVANLQEQLYQALTREAEAYKKIKHLHDQLLETSNRSPSGVPPLTIETPDIPPWGDTDLSQTSETCPQSPTPALIVSPTPQLEKLSRSRSFSQPSSPTLRLTDLNNHTKQLSLHVEDHPHEQVYPKYTNGGPSSNCLRQVWSPDSDSSQVITDSLAPCSRQLSDVRIEREKPPPRVSHKRSASLHSISKSSQLVKRKTSPEPLMTDGSHTGELSLDSQMVRGHSNATPVVKKPLEATYSLGRNVSTSKKKSNHHSRSRSSTMLHGLFRRRSKAPGGSPPTDKREPSSFTIEQIYQAFAQLTASNQKDPLSKFIDRPWTDVCSLGNSTHEEIQYRNAVWDMFQLETKYLIKLLQPLEQVYKGFLDELHFHGILKIAEVDKIFANLSELCELSSSVANDLFQLFNAHSGHRIAANGELILAFSMFGHKFNPVYQRFCVNVEKQRGFVRALQQLPEFQEYLRVCRSHEIVQRKDLSDLLIAPMQHQCHYQLLLDKVFKYTKDLSEKAVLGSAIKAFVLSLKELEGNIEENKRSAELLELQETLSWPTVAQLDPDAYIPEEIQVSLSLQQSSELLVSKDRLLLYKGPLRLLESRGKSGPELHAFLFTDLLLLTELKSSKKESNQLIRYQVFGHPLFLESVELHNVPCNQSHKHIFTLVEKTVLQQKIKAFSLQAQNKETKNKWVSQILHAQDLLWHRQKDQYIESDV